MTEEEKIKHVLKGIDDDAFQMLLAQNPRTVAQVTNIGQEFDELRKERALTRKPAEQDRLLCSLISDDSGALFARIQQFVREEVARQLSLVNDVAKQALSDLSPTIKSVIQQQIADARPGGSEPSPVVAPVSYADILPRTPMAAPLNFADQQQPMPYTYAEAMARPFTGTVRAPYIAAAASPGNRASALSNASGLPV